MTTNSERTDAPSVPSDRVVLELRALGGIAPRNRLLERLELAAPTTRRGAEAELRLAVIVGRVREVGDLVALTASEARRA